MVACFRAERSPNAGAEPGCCCPAELWPKTSFPCQIMTPAPLPRAALLLQAHRLTSVANPPSCSVLFFLRSRSVYPTKRGKRRKKNGRWGGGGGVEWCGLLKRPVVVSRRTGDGAFDSFFLYASSAVAATAAIKGSLNPNPCLAVAFASESVPSAVGIGSSCCLPGRHRATASRATHSAYKHSTRTTACGAKAAPRLPSPNTSSLPSPQARAYVPVHAP